VPIRTSVRVEGVRETMRAFDQLGGDAQSEMIDASDTLAKRLARLARAAGRAEGRQATLAANTVEVVKGKLLPTIQAGEGSSRGTRKQRAVTLGSEFGATRRFGWYAKGRYYDSVGKQYRRHHTGSYWFLDTVAKSPLIGLAYAKALDKIAEKWGRGG
jgi:hypothetical protein